MEKARIISRMETNGMKDNLIGMGAVQDQESYFMKMVHSSIMVNGSMIKPMVMVNPIITMEHSNMMENGVTTNLMMKVPNILRMETFNIKANLD
jgi:hypothetical protein